MDQKRNEPTLVLDVPDEPEIPNKGNWCGANENLHDVSHHIGNVGNMALSDIEFSERQTGPFPLTNIARVAVECDITYWNYYNDDQEALDYFTDILTVVTDIYENDTGVQIRLDSFMCSSAAYSYGTNPSTALSSAVNRWATNFQNITRDLTTILLGANVGGIAYLSSACYATGTNVNGMTNQAPGNIFDYVVVAHEMGHNLGTHHSHCYRPTVDNCWNTETACYNGTDLSVPSTGGSIMSYCHQRPGGVSNLRLDFGAPDMYGENSERIPTTIRNFVIARSSATCLPPIGATTGVITTEQVGSGTEGLSGSTLYIIIGASAGGGLLLVAVGATSIIAVRRRRRRNSNENRSNEFQLSTPKPASTIPASNQPPTPSSPLPQAPQSFPKGSNVMAVYTADGQQYRAVVLDFNNGKYLVSYPDYGEQEWLPLSSIRKA